jgi:O-antigen/teichoic acid export membrane protein
VTSPFTVIGKNLAVSATAHVAARLLNLALLAIAARTLGVEGLGTVAVATAVGTAVLFGTDLGLAARLVREAAARPTDEQDEYARALAFKLAAAIVVVLGCVSVFAVVPATASLARFCALMAAAAAIESFSVLNNAVCRAHERFELEAAGEILEAVVLFALGGAALLAGLPVMSVGVAAVVAACSELALSHALVRRYVRPGVIWPRDSELLRRALPYAVTSLGLVALMQLDVLFLSIVATQTEVGRYAAVSRLLLGGAYFAVLAAAVVLPRATGGYVRNASQFRQSAFHAARLAMYAAGAVAIVIVAAAAPVMTLIYGGALASAHVLLQLGSVFLFVSIAGVAPRTVLTAADRQAEHARSVAGGLVVTAISILLLGAAYGATGAVLALILGETTGLYLALRASRELWNAAEALPDAIAAAIGAAVAIALVVQLPTPPLISGVAGLGLYAAAVALSAAFLSSRRARRQ